jgi:hypothetical protein
MQKGAEESTPAEAIALCEPPESCTAITPEKPTSGFRTYEWSFSRDSSEKAKIVGEQLLKKLRRKHFLVPLKRNLGPLRS